MGIWHIPMPVPAPLGLQTSGAVHVPQLKPQPLAPQGFTVPHLQFSQVSSASITRQPSSAHAWMTLPCTPHESYQQIELPLVGGAGRKKGEPGIAAPASSLQHPTLALGVQSAPHVPSGRQTCSSGQVPQLTPQPASPHCFPAHDDGVQQLPL